jgi:cullin-associated NEDD8-dissociated protein 1
MYSLTDHNDVKPLGLMLLLRLGQLAPTSVIPRLDDTVESFKAIMKDVEVKEDTVKQDLERKGSFSWPFLPENEEADAT